MRRMHALGYVSGLETIALVGGSMLLGLWLAGYIGSKKRRRELGKRGSYVSWGNRVLGHSEGEVDLAPGRDPPRRWRKSSRAKKRRK
jgi:hypothetical protein